MRRLRRPNRPASPALGTVGMPQPSTSRANPQAPLASSSSTPPERPVIVQQSPSDGHGHVKDDALDLAITITSVGKEVASTFSIHGLAPGLAAFLEVLKKIQVMSETAKGVGNLKQEIDDLTKATTEFYMRNPGEDIPDVLRGTIDELMSTWKKTEETAAKMARRSKIKRFLSSASDARELRNLVGDVSSTIRRATLLGGWDIRLAVGKVQDKLDAEIGPKLDAMADQQDEELMPPHAESAPFDAKSARPREPCLYGTREDTLKDIRTWIRPPPAASVTVAIEPQAGGDVVVSADVLEFIYWVCGLAGTGKTTIACSIAQWCKNELLLAASFFFSRFDSKCNNPDLLFTSISRQLCRIIPAYKTKVVAAMKGNPDIVNSVAAVQFEKLILEPLEQLPQPFLRLVIVIDALDECRGDDSTSTIFYILSRFKERVARFFLLIMTGRPEPEIVAHFDPSRSGPLGKATKQLILHTVELEPVLQDIGRFLSHHLKRALGRRFPPGRPSNEDISTLASLSEGLFIFARTTVNLLTDKKSMDPMATLERVVRRQSHRSNSVSILGELYRQVLDEAHPDAEEELQYLIRQTVGTLVVAAEPFSVTTLAALLGLSDHVVRNILSELYSVLHIPDDDFQPIHFIHPTFPEFLLQVSSAPSLPPRFSFKAAEQHCAVLVCCLTTAKVLLRYDIADLRDPCVFKKEVTGLPNRVQQHIPSHLSYACRNWVVHFTLGGATSALNAIRALLPEFLCQYLLCWLEVCSLLNMLNEVPAALDAARSTCQSLEEPFSNLTPFLLDARRFVLTYGPCIDAAPLQVYHSALGLAPSSSLVAQTYSDVRFKRSLAVCRGVLREWGPGLDSFFGHNRQRIHAVTFSPDNTFLVSGGNDGMVKVWQASTRILILGIQASSEHIFAVTYSPNGLHIAAGGYKGLSIWHAASGAQIRVITDDTITHVAYAADGSRLLSVSYEGKVQLWRVLDGECLLSLDEDRWAQAGISPDGAVIAFTRGASLLLHDVSSGKHEDLELPDQGRAATFSSDGRYVAAGTERAIQIWSHQDKSLVRSINVPAGINRRLSFSSDGSRICCGCEDGLVCVWPVEGDGSARELQGHTWPVRDVAWRPDGSQIASAGDDGTIRLWDVTDHLPTRQPHALSTQPSSGPPRILVAAYKDGFTILNLPPQPVTGRFLPPHDGPMANDTPTFTAHPTRATAWNHGAHSTEVRLPGEAYPWAALTGQSECSRGATAAVSNNGSLVAYAVGRDICIHNLAAGKLVAMLIPEFKSGGVDSIVFSPNDSHLASGSHSPPTVAVWDVAAGTCVAYHHDHSDWVRCIALSSDGRFVVSGSVDETARVFDISTKQVTRVMGAHNYLVMQVVLTTDDRLLVTQDFGGALYIWDIETGSRIASFPPSDELWITTLHFSPTGFSVSTEDGEHTLELWKAGDRAWPVYYISKEGWVYAKGPGYTRQLVWLPPEWRHPVCSDGATFCVCEVEKNKYGIKFMRKLVELDMSRPLDHAGILYNK